MPHLSLEIPEEVGREYHVENQGVKLPVLAIG
jgi:hypothetical protein